MVLVWIASIALFDTILCILQIPDMYRKKMNRELWAFSVLLAIGTVIAILKSLNVDIPTPLNWIKTVYAPLVDLMKDFFK